MLLYTSLQFDIFDVLVRLFDLHYYNDWTPTMEIDDQLLIVLMKLKLNFRDIDLAHRFCVSRPTISNIFHTLVHTLHEMLFAGIVNKCFPSQLKCKGLFWNLSYLVYSDFAVLKFLTKTLNQGHFW